MNIEQRFQAPLAIVREIKKNVSWQKYSDMRIRRGHVLFQFNLSDGILEQVNLSNEPGRLVNKPFDPTKNSFEPEEIKVFHHSVKSQENCIYLSCLNMQSAIKRTKKIFGLSKFTRL